MSEPLEQSDDDKLYLPYLQDGQPALRDSFVGLLDVLGTSAELQTQKGARDLLAVTDRALERSQRGTDRVGVLVRWFTDNAALAVPQSRYERIWGAEVAKRAAAEATIVVAAGIQYQLANMGLFLRGGLTEGPFFASARFLFGAPLVQADQLEKRVADVPRVVLSKSFAEYAREEDAASGGSRADAFRWLLAEDDDGEVFVNYLGLVDEERADDDAWLLNHRDHIRSRLEHATCSKVRRKYLWVGQYHDRFCRRWKQGGAPVEHLLFDTEEKKKLKHIAALKGK